VKSIKVVGGDQCAPPNSECPKPLIIELLGPVKKGMLGGKGSVAPVPQVKVSFQVLPGSDLTVECDNPVSDHGGSVKAKIKTGSKIGDQYFKIIPEGFPKAAKTVRVISGISVSGAKQEVFAGSTLPKPLSVTVYDKTGKPAGRVPVFFRVASTPGKKAKLKCTPSSTITNANGVASTVCAMGDKTGTYKILVEVADPERGIQARGIVVKEMVMNLWGAGGLLITVLGGLAIFIFGMKSMTDGLQLVAGDKMKKVLAFFTSNRFAAVLAGTAVTGVIQSSSACTVMVVGFVNAGLLSLEQAIGVVFGANIGTTVTAQIISFKLGLLAFPCITIGLVVMMLAKKSIWKGWASTLMGFGMLFFGLGIMSHELKSIANFPSIIHFFRQFDCEPLASGGYMPLGAVLGAVAIGTFMTVVIQSSSATIGIAMALAGSGLINFYTAVPLILGDNIGTTVTANLAALGANRRAKQAAFAHFIFNIFGTAYMLIFFYLLYWNGHPAYLELINRITPGDAFSGENVTRHIAMAHSMFNIFNVILFLPFIALIAKICNMVIPVPDDADVKIQHLEPHLLATPPIAIEQTIQSIRYMTKEAWKMVKDAMSMLDSGKIDDKLVAKLEEREEKIDSMQEDVTDYLVKLTEQQLTEHQAAIIPHLMHCVNDAEKIADHTENLVGLGKRLKKSKKNFSKEARNELRDMWDTLSSQASHVISGLDSTDKREVDLAQKREIKLDKIAAKLEKNHIARLGKGKCDPVVGIIFLESVAEIEKIGDSFANIADRSADIQQHHLEL
jgi:Na/Pi-cotransporter